MSKVVWAWAVAKNELRLCYGFVRRDVGMGMIPIPIFTAASLLYRHAPLEEMAIILPSMFLPLS